MTNTAIIQANDGANAPAASPDQSKQLPARETTKKAQLIRLLERKAGYIIAAENPKGDKPARYRIAIRPEEAAGK